MTTTVRREAPARGAESTEQITDTLYRSVPGLTRVGDLQLEVTTTRCRLTGSAELGRSRVSWTAIGRDLEAALDEITRHLRRMAAALAGDSRSRDERSPATRRP